MNYRIPLAGLLAAIVMFVWTAIAHMMTPLGSAGISQIPDEAIPAAALTQTIGAKPGLYMFPWVDPKRRDADKLYAEKAKTMPSGFLVYHPAGQGAMMTGATLGAEFLKQLVCCLIAAFLLAQAGGLVGYVARVGFVFGVGVVAALNTNVSQAVWYGFPTTYIAAQMAIDLIAYLVAGVVLARMIRPSATPPADA